MEKELLKDGLAGSPQKVSKARTKHFSQNGAKLPEYFFYAKNRI